MHLSAWSKPASHSANRVTACTDILKARKHRMSLPTSTFATYQAVDHAGRDNELAYQEMLKGLELKRDIETILVGTNQAKVTGDTTTPRKTASILSWIASNTSKGTAGSPADPSPIDGTGARSD